MFECFGFSTCDRWWVVLNDLLSLPKIADQSYIEIIENEALGQKFGIKLVGTLGSTYSQPSGSRIVCYRSNPRPIWISPSCESQQRDTQHQLPGFWDPIPSSRILHPYLVMLLSGKADKVRLVFFQVHKNFNERDERTFSEPTTIWKTRL